MRNRRAPIQVGVYYGTLLARGPTAESAADGHRLWACSCANCGRDVRIASNNLRKAKSCGCAVFGKRKHGMRQSKEYRAWQAIKNRCLKPSNKDYPRYGGIGLTVEHDWVDCFERFLTDVGQAPSKDHQIDRIDTTRGYVRGNVRWATRSQQQRNKRNRWWYRFGEFEYEAAEELACLFKVTVTTICRWSKAGKHGISRSPRYEP